ncbi:threonine/serine ThrE exporter family protein [Arsenicicoccus sp. oral taxon 190]|uniref:threonine/serine ThrE exporter family protein n=1 Tax=Arsenicicoccus sp. oral taxon 190 TaxID=1658671 RepID=UPI000679FF6F|nr:threonine/serine exporter family protein [Arsenicicoccus sp. oral taxon 190]AKT50596.1 hypothetical protein ADJ73_03460 [Arsenicicoccus sp. oral taxon 190]
MPLDPADAVFTFALRAGDLMVRNGAASANVTHVLLAVTSARGFPGATASVTMGQISLSLLRPEQPPIAVVHNIGASGFNLEAVTETEQIVEAVITRELTIEEGLHRLDELDPEQVGHTPPVQLAGWGLMAAGFAWLLGGDWAACTLACLTAILIELTGSRLTRAELPGFFSHAIAGGAAAVVAQEIAPTEASALVITAALVSRLAGAATFGAAHDLLTGWFITAAGRLVEVALNTSGQVVGVILAISVASRLGVRLRIEDVTGSANGLLATTAAAVVVSVGFAIASQLRWRRMPAVAALAALVYLVYVGMQAIGWGKLVSAATAATTLGVITVLIAPYIKIPSSGALGVVLAPLLPGMLVYQGFVAMALHHPGSSSFLEAGGVALSTGAGAVLGQFIAAQVIGHTRRVRHDRLRLQGDETIHTNPHVLTAQWLSAPTFRRPYLVDTIGALHEQAESEAESEVGAEAESEAESRSERPTIS